MVDDTLRNAVALNTLGSQVMRLFSLYNDTRLSYNKVFNNIHKVSGIVGLRYQANQSEQDYAYSYNSATDQLISVGYGLTNLRDLGGQIGKWNWLNNYYSANYSLYDKYFASANLAIDGSSRFGDSVSNALKINGVNYAVLPSVSAAWLISSENFMQSVKGIDVLKLRASYGLVGNDDIGNYTRRQYYVSQNLLGLEGLVRGNIANPTIQWEKVTKANVGVDLSALDERIYVSIDAYSNKTSKMVTYQPLSTVNAINFAVLNSGGMKSSGLELAFNSRILNRQVKWDAGFTASTYKTKITSVPNGKIVYSYANGSYISQVGKEANLFYGFKTSGVFKSADEAAAYSYRTATTAGDTLSFGAGDVHFVDQDKNGLIDDKDRVVIGNPNPDLFGSITSRVNYKKLTLDALFTYSIGNDVYNYTRAQLESESNFYNQTPAVLRRWRTEGQITDVPKATYGDPVQNSRFSDRWIEDGSYLRLRSLTVSYDIPVAKVKAFKYAKAYLTGYNLITFSKYLGYDPEFSSTSSIYTQGVDTNLEPIYKSVQLGVRIGL